MNVSFTLFLFIDYALFNPYISQLTLQQLNEDCLVHVLEYLGLNDLYAMGCVSDFFRNVIQSFNRKLNCTLSKINAKYISNFLEIVGNHIKRLTVSTIDDCDSDTVINFFLDVQNYCTNIKYLIIRKWTYLNFDTLEILASQLISLRLEECRFYDRRDIMHRRFAMHPYIISRTSFNSLSPPTIQINLLRHLVALTKLEMYKCDDVRPELLLDYLKNNERLVEMSLFQLKEFKKDMYNVAFFDEMGKHLRHIERFSIDMDTTNEIQFLSHLPNLKSLQLINYSVVNERVIDTLLRKLSERDLLTELDLYHCDILRSTYRTISQFSKLESLKLCKNFWVSEQYFKEFLPMRNLKKFCCFDCIMLSDDGLISLLKMAPKIEALDCSWCFQVTNRLVYEIVKLYREEKRGKLYILVGGRTKMTESILEVKLDFIPETLFPY